MYTENFYGHLKSKIYSEIPHEQAKYIEDITRWRKDMNFMFEWQELYLTSERSERVRYCFCHENIKFILSRLRVMFFLVGTSRYQDGTSWDGNRK